MEIGVSHRSVLRQLFTNLEARVLLHGEDPCPLVLPQVCVSEAYLDDFVHSNYALSRFADHSRIYSKS
eukprot:5821010-Amphidinium_carterae.1